MKTMDTRMAELYAGLSPSVRVVLFRLARAFDHLEGDMTPGRGGERVDGTKDAGIGDLRAAGQHRRALRMAEETADDLEHAARIIRTGRARVAAWEAELRKSAHKRAVARLHSAGDCVPNIEGEDERRGRGPYRRRRLA